jgi:hypothetical protein
MTEITEFDLSQFEVQETAVLDVQNMKDDGPLLHRGEPVRIHLHSPGSAAYVRASAKLNRASEARMQAAMRGKKINESVEEKRQRNAEFLAECTHSIENFPLPGGALALYNNPKLGYITNQVDRFLTDWANFSRG